MFLEIGIVKQAITQSKILVIGMGMSPQANIFKPCIVFDLPRQTKLQTNDSTS